MPRKVNWYGNDHDVATENELLKFVNKARAAGGANVLEALLPSQPSDPSQCLIARGLNFSCNVNSGHGNPRTGKEQWGMELPENMPYEQARSIAKSLSCPLIAYNWKKANWQICTGSSNEICDEEEVPFSERVVLLPEHIGNAATAFDLGLAFQEYAE